MGEELTIESVMPIKVPRRMRKIMMKTVRGRPVNTFRSKRFLRNAFNPKPMPKIVPCFSNAAYLPSS